MKEATTVKYNKKQIQKLMFQKRTNILLTNLCKYIVDDENRLSEHDHRNPYESCRRIFRHLGFRSKEELSDRIYKVPILNMEYERCISMIKRTLHYIFNFKTGDYSEDQYIEIMKFCGFTENEIQMHLEGRLY